MLLTGPRKVTTLGTVVGYASREHMQDAVDDRGGLMGAACLLLLVFGGASRVACGEKDKA